MDAPVLSIVGRSGSGKTTLVEGAVKELSRKGVRVAVVKHTHKALDIDTKGKDSWRFREAGASRTVLAGLNWTMTQESASSIHDILERERLGVDLVLVEGFSRDGLRPRIEVLAPGREPYLPPEEVDAYLVRGNGPTLPLQHPWRPATTAELLSVITEMTGLQIH